MQILCKLALLTALFPLFQIHTAAASSVGISRIDGAIDPVTLIAGQQHLVRLRLESNAGTKWNVSNGFRIYSPDGAVYGPVSGDTLPSLTKAANFDLGYFVRCYSCDGIGSDTIGFAGIAISGLGLPGGFAADAWEIEFTSRIEDTGKTICIDSSFYPPTNTWLWSASGGTNTSPSWSGQRCMTIRQVDDQPPTITNCPDSMLGSHCNTLTYNFDGTDAEDMPFTFEIVSGPGAINRSTGVWSWNTAALEHVGERIILEVAARDGLTNILGPVCRTEVMVSNSGPSITDGCGTTTIMSTGATKLVDLDAYDDCDPMSWSITPINGAIGAVSIDAAGTVSFTAAQGDVGIRAFSVCVSDGIDSACCGIQFDVLNGAPYAIRIEAFTDGLTALFGEFIDIDLFLERIDPRTGLGGFDLLIAYDNAALSFQQASQGDIYTECGWEFFDYRFGANGNCNNACPSGLIRLVGLAETNNGPDHHPTCTSPKYVGSSPTTLASLRFLVSSDPIWECVNVPLRFFWVDCGDNTLSNASGTDLYISNHNFEFGSIVPIDTSDSFPTFYGAPDDCFRSTLKDTVIRNVDFYNSIVQIHCVDEIDATGDINLNGTANEIADLVIFSNYFLHGIGAFGSHFQGSTAASDVNGNGVTLELADLQMLYLVIMGNTLPHPVETTVGSWSVDNGVLYVSSDVLVGPVFFTVEGDVTPIDIHPNYQVRTAFDGVNTKILVVPDFFTFTIDQTPSPEAIVEIGNATILSIEAAGEFGEIIEFTQSGTGDQSGDLPTAFALHDNYPNPFNPTTTIAYALPEAAEVQLTIYNLLGQPITTLVDQRQGAGNYQVEWNGTDRSGTAVASGIYFYRLQTGSFSESRKMMLLK